jgi:hypothetical protein
MSDPVQSTPDLDPEVEARLVELAAKHNVPREKVHQLTAGKFVIVVREPARMVWRRFIESVSADPKNRPTALETMVRDCLLDPDRKAFEAMLDDKPALGMIFGGEVADLAGDGLVAAKNG